MKNVEIQYDLNIEEHRLIIITMSGKLKHFGHI